MEGKISVNKKLHIIVFLTHSYCMVLEDLWDVIQELKRKEKKRSLLYSGFL